MAIYDPDYDEPLLVGTPLLSLKPEAAYKIYVARWPVEGLPQTGEIHTVWRHRHTLCPPPDRYATLTSTITNLWVPTEICGRDFAAFPNWLLGQSA